MPKRPVDSMQVLAIMPIRTMRRTPCCLSCRSRSVLAKPLDPQCVDNDIAGLGSEVVVERSAPTVFGEDLRVSPGELVGRGIVEGDVIAGLPAVVRHEEYLQSPSRAVG